ncbi:hypothetical protein [Polynucleobacter sp.]
MGQCFVGTLFLASITSAPEVAVTISALRIGAIGMATLTCRSRSFRY